MKRLALLRKVEQREVDGDNEEGFLPRRGWL